jgi:hypothetical protein
VIVGGVTANSTIPVDIAQLPNGSFPFRVLPPSGWRVAPLTGSVRILAAPAYVTLAFTPVVYNVTFSASGLDPGTSWGVQVGRLDLNGTAGNETFWLPNGSFTYQIDAVIGYNVATPPNATFTVTGGGLGILVVFVHVASVVGYLRGDFVPVSAEMIVDGSQVASPGGSFDLTLLPGSHAFEIEAPSYVPYFGNVTISAGNTTFLTTIHLALARTTVGTTTPGGGTRPPPAWDLGWTLWIAIAAVIALVAAVAIALARRK